MELLHLDSNELIVSASLCCRSRFLRVSAHRRFQRSDLGCRLRDCVVMAGSVEVEEILGHSNRKPELLTEDFDPTAVVSEPLPALVVEDGQSSNVVSREEAEEEKKKKSIEIVLGRNVHTTCLAVTEPDANDEFTGDKEAYMASVLARYRRTLIDRTKHHLGKTKRALARFLACYISVS